MTHAFDFDEFDPEKTKLWKICANLFVQKPKGDFVGMFANYNFKPQFLKPAYYLYMFWFHKIPAHWPGALSIFSFLSKYLPDGYSPKNPEGGRR